MLFRQVSLYAAIVSLLFISACGANSGWQSAEEIASKKKVSSETLQHLLNGNDWRLDLKDSEGDNHSLVLTFSQRKDGSIYFSNRVDNYGRSLLDPRVTINGKRVRLDFSLSQDCGPRNYVIRLRLKDDGTFSANGTRERSRCRGGSRPVSGSMQ